MARVGGGALAHIFRTNSAHTTIYAASSGTTAATAIASAMLAIGGASGNDILEQTDFTYNDDGSVSIKFNQTKYDEAFQTALDVLCPRTAAAASATATEEKTDETGRKIGGSVSVTTQQQVVLTSYGALGDDSKIPVSTYIGYFKQTSGSRSQKGGAYVAPGLEFTSVAAKNALVVPNTLYDATKITAASVTLTSGSHEKVTWVSGAA